MNKPVEPALCHAVLVFYNYLLKCFVLIDLKIGKLTHQDIGQMDSYVRLYEDLFKVEGDNPTLGLILCSEKNETIARYSELKESRQLFARKAGDVSSQIFNGSGSAARGLDMNAPFFVPDCRVDLLKCLGRGCLQSGAQGLSEGLTQSGQRQQKTGVLNLAQRRVRRRQRRQRCNLEEFPASVTRPSLMTTFEVANA